MKEEKIDAVLVTSEPDIQRVFYFNHSYDKIRLQRFEDCGRGD